MSNESIYLLGNLKARPKGTIYSGIVALHTTIKTITIFKITESYWSQHLSWFFLGVIDNDVLTKVTKWWMVLNKKWNKQKKYYGI